MRFSVALIAALLASCKPDFGVRDSTVDTTRILAVRAEPAEAKPGEAVSWAILVASPSGTLTKPDVAWAFCATPKVLAENDIVSRECLGTGVRVIGNPSPTADALLPSDACSLFGPETPPGDFRPRDPDATGGYYQPVRAEVSGLVGFGLTRVRCNLANAPADAALDFQRRYLENRNPHLLPLQATLAGAPQPLARVPAGARVELVASWGDGDAESYVAFDIASQAVTARREAMRVSWFATAGTFDSDRTGRAEEETPAFAENGWQAPSTPGTVHLWIVLRDSRGGVDFASYDVDVVPP